MAFAPRTLRSFPPRDPSSPHSSSTGSLLVSEHRPLLRDAFSKSPNQSPCPHPYSLAVRGHHLNACLLSVSATRMLLAKQGSVATSVPWCPRSVFLNGWWCVYPHSSKTKSTDAGKGLGDIHAAASPSAKHLGPLKTTPAPQSAFRGGWWEHSGPRGSFCTWKTNQSY